MTPLKMLSALVYSSLTGVPATCTVRPALHDVDEKSAILGSG
jgi:hypothetical protein